MTASRLPSRLPLRLLLPALITLPLWSTPVVAQPAAVAAPLTPAAQPPGQGEQQALKIFRMLDADGDGRISLKEARVGFRLKPSLAEDFRRTDLNGDGHLTEQEIRAAAERRRAERTERRRQAQELAARTAPGAAATAPKPASTPKPAP